jgi:hypothetical protein
MGKPKSPHGDVNRENSSTTGKQRQGSIPRSLRGPVKLACNDVFMYYLMIKINNYLVKRSLIKQICLF